MKETSSSAANDPRQPSTAKPYVPPQISPQDLPVDYSGFLAVVFGVTGVMFRRTWMLCTCVVIAALIDTCANTLCCSHVAAPLLEYSSRYKLCSWLAIIFCAQSLVNMKHMENDLKQISMAMMFAIMGLVTNYLGPSRAPKPQG